MQVTHNADKQPIVKLNFDNGWTISILKRWENNISNCHVISYPTDDMNSPSKHHGSELSDNEVAAVIAEVSAYDPI